MDAGFLFGLSPIPPSEDAEQIEACAAGFARCICGTEFTLAGALPIMGELPGPSHGVCPHCKRRWQLVAVITKAE